MMIYSPVTMREPCTTMINNWCTCLITSTIRILVVSIGMWHSSMLSRTVREKIISTISATGPKISASSINLSMLTTPSTNCGSRNRSRLNHTSSTVQVHRKAYRNNHKKYHYFSYSSHHSKISQSRKSRVISLRNNWP